ncbi:MAG TPA: hypothetical protein VGJ22_00275 [Anaerolineales bacterium]|jgi:hypothetical protein
MTRGTQPHLLDSYSGYLLLLFPMFLLFGRDARSPVRVFTWVLALTLQLSLAWGFLEWKWIA